MYSCQETGKWPELPDSCACCNFVQLANWHTESEAQDYCDFWDGWVKSIAQRSTSVNFRADKTAEIYIGLKILWKQTSVLTYFHIEVVNYYKKLSMGLQTVSKSYTDKGSPKFSITQMEFVRMGC